MPSKDNSNAEERFNWLRREDRGPNYISYSESSDRQACSFDFGDNGCSASCDYGGELLNMSSKDEEEGIIFATSGLENTYRSSLDHAQRHSGGGGKAIFGLRIAVDQEPFHKVDLKDRGSRLKLGQMTERGCFNYRWPYNEYALLSNDGHDAEPRETGTCARVAFVKDNILYQLIRLEKGCRPEADRCHYVPWSGRITLAVGGPIEFAAFDADNACAKPKYDHLFEYSMQDGTRVTKGLTNQLEVRVRQLDGNEYVTLPLEQQEDDGAAGDSYVVHAELPEGDNVNIRGRQVILIAEFRLRKVDSQSPWPETPTSVQTFRYLGIHSDSPMATGVMWETIFFKREQESNYFSELPEANIIGRCVEKILTVDLVPTAFKSQGSFEFEENGPLALVSNLFLRPNIDLESLFWKVRFLVKAYQFLGKFKQLCSKTISKSNEDALGEEPKTFPLISHASDIELHHHEAKSTGYIETLVDRQMERLLKSIGRAIAYLARVFIQPKTQPNLKSKILQPSYYYIAMTLWYTMKRCSLSEFIQKWIVTDGMQSWSPDESLLVQSLPPENLQPKDKERGKMAFLKWYHYTSILSLCGEKDFLPEAWKKIKLDDKVSLLERDARRAVAVRLSMCKPYSAEDEILDRMGFLAESLNAESTHQAGSVASLTTRRMLDRDATRYLNPGRYSDGENGKTSGPWEIYALCHHSRLLVEEYKYSKDNKRTRKQKIEEADIYRRELSIFLNAEACLSPCWERTNSALFRSEATSVLASTLLGICQKDLSLGPQADERLESTYINTATSSMEIHRLRTQALRKVESTVPPAIEWKRYKPPHRHHDKFNNSLDRVYERTWILFSSLPGISNIRWPQPDLNESDVRYMLETYKVTVIDLKASIPDQWDNHTWQGYKSEVFTVDTLKPNKTATAMAKLSASLIDQEVQHRTIILRESWNRMADFGFLRLFCGIIHAASGACFINHISRIPEFSYQNGNIWVTRITLRSWSKPGNNKENRNSPKLSESMTTLLGSDIDEEETTIEMPRSLRDSLRFINKASFDDEQESPCILNLEVSSIVLSTNDFGDISQCTVISELLDGATQFLERQCKDIWEKFIHQPQTARCLVFLVILGLLCKKMVAGYRDSIKCFAQTTLKSKNTFDGNDPLKASHPLIQLRLGLWSLDSLSKLYDSLESSLRCIEQASAEMQTQIRYGPGRRSEALEKMCQESLEVFQSNLSKLVVLRTELKQKIESSNRYKDFSSTILSLEDSKNSIRQNNTFKKLTYLTIGYLPIGLITAIFAIPSDQNVLIPSMGLGGYVASVVTLCIITFIATIFLKQLQQGFRKLIPNVPSFSGGGGGGRGLRSILGKYWTRSGTASGRGEPTSSSMTVDMEKGQEY